MRGGTRQGMAKAVFFVLLGAAGAIAGCGPSHASTAPSASSVAHYCEVAGKFRTESREDLYTALRRAAPTSELRSEIEGMLALNDPNYGHFQRVHAYTVKACGIDLPILQG